MIDPAFIARLVALQAAAAGLNPISKATSIMIAAVLTQGRGVIATAEQSLLKAGAPLDLPDPSGFPAAYPAALLALSAAANDSSGYSDVRGYLGRATFNIQQGKP